ncbi:glycine/D-amino acid oxidase-like deaminating enzyme/nitrite reductase/ring-hydroxylating ferredoxin subunit [Peribacillus deserti]|uniref:Glycine/D-amino acid oxidase-like deaminating enzyme/nitrite reductase/ring-hydroxylating ferredoxin subunit n=1 Tax=Peribacillus deserti TaxID=673318 RepID=A0ABS2QCS1_9BACI|nr:FAD-dependent oxidoreductase [Peribacillus deserti]MBM7690599.1 glycine/D-amino acid oxidase-like deaminating enzyme/nitrite reductase/ring-hydroxylating ferredoxin subunit [Peribacillus deserti]
MSEFKAMPQVPEPYWRGSAQLKSFPALNENIETDIAIIGGGITGITAAYLLLKEGKKVALIEADKILNGTTGHTTAKISAQHGLIYSKLIEQHGEQKAKLYYEANSNAIQFIRNLVNEYNIDCDFSTQDAYVFTESSEYLPKLEDETRAYEKLGIDGTFVETTPLSFPVKGAVLMRNQAQFHPLKYLSFLVDRIVEMGGQIYENTTAGDVKKGPPTKVTIKNQNKNEVTSKHVLICSHYPSYNKEGKYFARLHQERSYVLAVKTKKEFPGGMYINAEKPVRSLRYTMIDGEKAVLFGGDGHKTGQDLDTKDYYEELVPYAEKTYGIKEIPYRWSAQDVHTLDGVPYIGHLTEDYENVYVATGYAKWGMTNGTNAASLIRDLVIGADNPYAEVFTPRRFNPNPTIKNFIKDNAEVAMHFVEGKLDKPNHTLDEVGIDQGRVVTVNGQRAGAYRDKNGELFLVDTTCTHMKCELNWNNGDRTWDCPCHGSRFAVNGDVIDGPAKNPLKKVEFKQEDTQQNSSSTDSADSSRNERNSKQDFNGDAENQFDISDHDNPLKP